MIEGEINRMIDIEVERDGRIQRQGENDRWAEVVATMERERERERKRKKETDRQDREWQRKKGRQTYTHNNGQLEI